MSTADDYSQRHLSPGSGTKVNCQQSPIPISLPGNALVQDACPPAIHTHKYSTSIWRLGNLFLSSISVAALYAIVPGQLELPQDGPNTAVIQSPKDNAVHPFWPQGSLALAVICCIYLINTTVSLHLQFHQEPQRSSSKNKYSTA